MSLPDWSPFPEYPLARIIQAGPEWFWTARADLIPLDWALREDTLAGWAWLSWEAERDPPGPREGAGQEPGVAEHHLLGRGA